jgi:hypothetical protein
MDYSTQIAALEKALASGELRVESDGDMIIYRTIEDLRRAVDYFKQQQALFVAGRPSTPVAVFDPR